MDVVDRLIESACGPTPPGARVGLVTTADGLRLRFAAFDAPRPRGTVLLLQGRAEYIESYFETIRDLQARGFTVLTFDWRGQGGSQRLTRNPRKGHVSTFAAYDFDLDAVLRLVAPTCPTPLYVLGHSTGGLVAIANGARLAREVRRMVLSAPFLGLGEMGPAEPVARALARILRALAMGRDFVPGGGATAIHTTPFPKNFLTSDPERHARVAEMSWRHPEIAIGSPTVGWLAAAFEAMDRVFAPDALAAWRLPTLLFTCGEDRVVSNRAIEAFATRTVNTDHLVIPGARHELLRERDRYREQFWAAFDAFVPGSDAPPVGMPKPVVVAPTPAETTPRIEPEAEIPPSTEAPEPIGEAAVVAALAAATAAIALPSDDAPAKAPEAAPSDDAAASAASDVGEEGQDPVVQPAIAGGDDAAAVDGAAAVPGGDDAAGPLDHRDQGDDVVGLQPGLDHHVDEAARDHAVGVAVDPVARQPDP